MNPETFHDLLERATADAPPPPGYGAELAAGRRRLRRRRLATTTTSVLATAAVAGGLVAASDVLDREPRAVDVPVATPPDDAAELLQACREGNQSERATRLVFGDGTPTVTASVRTHHQVILAIESAGGRYWAECFVHLDDQEFASGMTVYDSAGTSTSTSWSSGGGCGLEQTRAGECTTWTVATVDRLPEEVAAVRYDLGDGTSTTVPAADGYVVLNTANQLPDGERVHLGGDVSFEALTRVTYLDAAGTALAAQAFDGTGSGPDGEKINGLPLLEAYPSLRQDQPIY